MKVMPIRFVADMDSSARFCTALGLTIGDGSRSGNWAELAASGGVLALHTTRSSQGDEPGHIELSFEAEEPLEEVAERLYRGRVRAGVIVDENLGRSLRTAGPDGVMVQINEHDRELCT